VSSRRTAVRLVDEPGDGRPAHTTIEEPAVPLYCALTYTDDVDWSAPEQADQMVEYGRFGEQAAEHIRGGSVLYPTATATTVRVRGGRGGEVVTSDGPYAEAKEVLAGFYLLECADLDEAIALAARIPAAWSGAVEVRPVIPIGG
jgi:hypothetical protein